MTRGRATDHQRAHVSRHENVACLETNACTHTHTPTNMQEEKHTKQFWQNRSNYVKLRQMRHAV